MQYKDRLPQTTSTLPLLMPVAMPWRPSSPHGNTPHLIPHIKIKCSASVAAAQCCPGSHGVQLFSAAACQCCWCRYSTLPLSSAAGCCTRDVAAASTTEQRQQQWQEWQRGGSSQAAAAVEAAAIINKTLLILSSFPAHSADSGKLRTSYGPHFFLLMIVFPRQTVESFVFRGIPADSGCPPWQECILGMGKCSLLGCMWH